MTDSWIRPSISVKSGSDDVLNHAAHVGILNAMNQHGGLLCLGRCLAFRWFRFNQVHSTLKCVLYRSPRAAEVESGWHREICSASQHAIWTPSKRERAESLRNRSYPSSIALRRSKT